MNETLTVILAGLGSVLLALLLMLGIVAVVAIVVFARTANLVVGRTRREDLPGVLETVGRTHSGLVAALGQGIRQAVFAATRIGASQPSAGPVAGVPAPADPAIGPAAVAGPTGPATAVGPVNEVGVEGTVQ
ncbi:hypothetical protein AB0D46_35240 [Streptomyces sp. NPDC048383]|uniref:hypothetical protein n=1 Tax=Streptomyces sp. NPDC048383 TaxID=3155386 RepID=UPI0034431058